MNQNEISFFYCYDPRVMKWLRFTKNIKYICTGINPSTRKQFWQFLHTGELTNSLEELKNVKL